MKGVSNRVLGNWRQNKEGFIFLYALPFEGVSTKIIDFLLGRIGRVRCNKRRNKGCEGDVCETDIFFFTGAAKTCST